MMTLVLTGCGGDDFGDDNCGGDDFDADGDDN